MKQLLKILDYTIIMNHNQACQNKSSWSQNNLYKNSINFTIIYVYFEFKDWHLQLSIIIYIYIYIYI